VHLLVRIVIIGLRYVVHKYYASHVKTVKWHEVAGLRFSDLFTMNITMFWNVMPVLWEICFDTFFFSGTSCLCRQAL